MAKETEIRDTDVIALDRELRRALDEIAEPHGSCLLVSSVHTRTLPVRLRVGHRYRKVDKPKMSVSRIAWALANPHDHLGVDDYAVHTCENTGADGLPLCINGAHLRKGERDDLHHAKALRAKGFFKEAA